jgi:hypothetical protein
MLESILDSRLSLVRLPLFTYTQTHVARKDEHQPYGCRDNPNPVLCI